MNCLGCAIVKDYEPTQLCWTCFVQKTLADNAFEMEEIKKCRDKRFRRKYTRKKLLGRDFSEEDEYTLLAEQDGRCAICNAYPHSGKLSLDHCHKTGAIRGFLCDRCNLGLGMFEDNPALFHVAMIYLLEAQADL